jgi:hypothetical protein
VFALKLKALRDDLLKSGEWGCCMHQRSGLQTLSKAVRPHAGYLGHAISFVSVIEFQKRGMPRAHLLLWV